MANFGKQTYRMMLLAGVMAAAGGAFADTLNIALKPGWNFIGLPGEMSVQELQKANPMISDVAVLRQGLIVNAMWNNLKMARGEGVAVYATGKTTLTLTIPDMPKGRALARADTITLPAGMSALALPVETTVSPRIFGDRAVLAWENNGWSAYPNAAAKRYGYANAPVLKAIKPGQGFLVIGDTPLSANVSDLTSQLQPFASSGEMLDYLRQQAIDTRSYTTTSGPVTTRVTYDASECANKSYSASPLTPTVSTPTSSSTIPTTSPTVAVTSPTSSSSGTTNTTSTNRQESGVDESDIVKHNGRHVFYTSNRSKRILFTDFAALAGNTKPLGEIALGGCLNIEAMYLDGDRLAVVHGDGMDYRGGWSYSGYSTWNRESSLDIFDVADPANAKKIASLKLDGSLVESRMIAQQLYLVVRYAPYLVVDYKRKNACVSDGEKICVPASSYYPTDYYHCYPASMASNISASCMVPDYDNPIVKQEKLVPNLTDKLTGATQALFTPEKFYAPAKLDQNSNTVSVLALDIATGKLIDKVAISGQMDTLYMSTDNLYLVSADYPRYFGWKIAADNETRSKVYRFSVSGGLDYTGSTFVDGTVLNQFSLGEYQGVLRIATTRRFWDKDWRSNTDNQVATLQGGKNAFAQAGVLGGLGKAGETIRSARFLGNKGYLVTFRNTDPLYTLDLSDPKNPRKVGELSIPGYSSYLHPVDEQRLLSIGRDASENGSTKGVLVQLFDIADFANPKLADKRIYGTDSLTRSSAENDHKAFTYRPDGILAFDLESKDCGKTDYWLCPNTTTLKLLKVDGLKFQDSGEIKGSDIASGYYSYGSDKYRGLLFDYDGKTWAAFLKGEEWKAGLVGK